LRGFMSKNSDKDPKKSDSKFSFSDESVKYVCLTALAITSLIFAPQYISIVIILAFCLFD
jgi:hypothetical protein